MGLQREGEINEGVGLLLFPASVSVTMTYPMIQTRNLRVLLHFSSLPLALLIQSITES